MFERLYTSRTVPGRIVGTGIGLAIVHELAVTMGGDARVEPIDAEGTRFVVTIPAGSRSADRVGPTVLPRHPRRDEGFERVAR